MPLYRTKTGTHNDWSQPQKPAPRWIRVITRTIAFMVFAICMLVALAAYLVLWPEQEAQLLPSAEGSISPRA